MPRDTLSILHSHLFRPCQAYDKVAEDGTTELRAWNANRLRALPQLDLFASAAGGLGRAMVEAFARDRAALNSVSAPDSLIHGLLRADERVRTLKAFGLVCHIVLGREAPQWAAEASQVALEDWATRIVAVAQTLLSLKQLEDKTGRSYRQRKKETTDRLLQEVPGWSAVLRGLFLSTVPAIRQSPATVAHNVGGLLQLAASINSTRRERIAMRLSTGLTIILVNDRRIFQSSLRRALLFPRKHV